MKITHNKVGKNLNLVDTAKSDRGDKASGAKRTSEAVAGLGIASTKPGSGNAVDDAVRLSPRALEAKKIKELAIAAPDVDEAKVARFQKLIDNGDYKVDSRAVADRMVDEHLETSD